MVKHQDFEITRLTGEAAAANVTELGALLIDAVAGGASIGFMAPLSPAEAQAYWREIADGVARGQVILLAARAVSGGPLVGTVQLGPERRANGTHRAELRKLLVHRDVRRRGLGKQLLCAAEAQACAGGYAVLVLDTETGSAAEGLYRGNGYTAAGVIPDYARTPDGRLHGTTVFWRRLDSVSIGREDPRQPEVATLVAELDAHLGTLYALENIHRLAIERLAEPDVRFFVARRAGVAIGCGALRIDRDYAEVKRMYVRPSARGFAIGQRLLAALTAEARAAGLPLLRLETGSRQPEALHVYRKAGFAPRGPFADYPADPASVFMELTLA